MLHPLSHYWEFSNKKISQDPLSLWKQCSLVRKLMLKEPMKLLGGFWALIWQNWDLDTGNPTLKPRMGHNRKLWLQHAYPTTGSFLSSFHFLVRSRFTSTWKRHFPWVRHCLHSQLTQESSRAGGGQRTRLGRFMQAKGESGQIY